MLDQRALPGRVRYLDCTSVADVCDAISALAALTRRRPAPRTVVRLRADVAQQMIGTDRERYADACVEQLARFAPNLPAAILEREVLAPPDIERVFGLVDGSIFQGEQGLDQMAFMRPSPALAKYATPLHGLYLCGAGTHPGGGVMAASGHNAAHRILKDRKRENGLRGRFRARKRGAVPA